MSLETGIYHTCFTRNNDETRVLIGRDNDEQFVIGGTNDPFWDRKLYYELKRSRKSKKVGNEKLRQSFAKRKKTLALFHCKYVVLNILF